MYLFNRVAVFSILVVFSSGCSTLPSAQTTITKSTIDTKSLVTTESRGAQSPLLCNEPLNYVPLPAFDAPNYHEVIIVDSETVRKDLREWPKNDNAATNKLLPNIATAISVDDLAVEGGVSLFGQGKFTRKLITIDFMKYRSEPILGIENTPFLYARIGAGLRVTIEITTTDASLSTGNLFAIAASVKSGKTTGLVSVDVIGMDSIEITLSMPFTSDLSEGSIQQIIEALAVIKSKLHQKDTTLDPHFISRIECGEREMVAKTS